jgi:hypothetical protein
MCLASINQPFGVGFCYCEASTAMVFFCASIPGRHPDRLNADAVL